MRQQRLQFFKPSFVRIVVTAFLILAALPARVTAQQSNTTASPAPYLAPQVSGSGTKDFIPIWTNTTTLGKSALYEKDGLVGVKTTHPMATLEVNGTAQFDSTVSTGSSLELLSGNLNLPQTDGSGDGVISMGGDFSVTCLLLPRRR
jgi:hypothetical protein